MRGRGGIGKTAVLAGGGAVTFLGAYGQQPRTPSCGKLSCKASAKYLGGCKGGLGGLFVKCFFLCTRSDKHVLVVAQPRWLLQNFPNDVGVGNDTERRKTFCTMVGLGTEQNAHDSSWSPRRHRGDQNRGQSVLCRVREEGCGGLNSIK